MAKTWTLTELVAEWRKYTGRTTSDQISDEDVKVLINDYYVNHFPDDAEVDEFDVFYTQALSATDDGVYSIPQSVDRFDDPVTINGSQICFFRDRELFFASDPHLSHHHHFRHISTIHNTLTRKFEDEQYITNPGLVIGSSDSAKVKNVAFSYSINDFSYSKAEAESDLVGSAIPQGKYGAWSLRVDKDGTITVAAATDNATGYLTPRLALEGLTSSDSESAYMGYVTVIKSDGAFTPATTDLGAANVTSTFTDGRFESRTFPVSALLYGQNLYVWPKPNDIYQFKALQIAQRPDELVEDTDTVDDPKWGPAVAIGAANIYLLTNDGPDVVQDLAGLTAYFFDQIKSDKIKRLLGQTVVRTF